MKTITEMRLFKFGVFTDLHLITGSSNVIGLDHLKACVDYLNSIDLDFTIQLGDIIASGNGAISKVTREFENLSKPLFNVLGNQDYNIDEGEESVLSQILFPNGTYYEFSPCSNWRCVVLDGTDISLFRHPQEARSFKIAQNLIVSLKAANAGNAYEWNGALGDSQMEWFESVLAVADTIRESVIVFCHFPCFPSNEIFSLLNASTLLSIIERHYCVKAYLSGHQHSGFYAIRRGTHFISFKSMSMVAQPSFATITVQGATITINGIGSEVDRILPINTFDEEE